MSGFNITKGSQIPDCPLRRKAKPMVRRMVRRIEKLNLAAYMCGKVDEIGQVRYRLTERDLT